MPKVIKTFIGQRFGKLVVRERADNLGNAVAYECVCDCGNIKIARSYSLHNGETKSCGCLLKENGNKSKGKPKKNRIKLRAGAILDVDYSVKGCPIYKLWRQIFERCYYSKNEITRRTYEGCTISDDWKYFSRFKSWAESKYQPGLALDKDIIVPGNKVYGEEFCTFVPSNINSLLTDRKLLRGDLALGVCYINKTKVMKNERSKPYAAKVSERGKSIFLGMYKTELEAHKAWQIAKAIVIENSVTAWSKEDSFCTNAACALLKRAWDLRIDESKGIITEGF